MRRPGVQLVSEIYRLLSTIMYNTRGYAGGLDGRRSQRRIVNIKRVRSNAKS